jgi:hypothetical protein
VWVSFFETGGLIDKSSLSYSYTDQLISRKSFIPSPQKGSSDVVLPRIVNTSSSTIHPKTKNNEGNLTKPLEKRSVTAVVSSRKENVAYNV